MAKQTHHKNQSLQQTLLHAQDVASRGGRLYLTGVARAALLCISVAGGALLASQATAQVVPDAGQVSRELNRPAPSLPKAEPSLPKAQEVRPALRPANGFSMTLSGVRFSGNTQILETDLQLLVLESLGKRVGFNELQAAADAVSNHYRSKGFFVARAYLPQQEIKDGIVEIAVLEGKVGKAEVKQAGSVRTQAGVVQALLDANVPAGSVVHEKSLERAALLANDLPGINAGISLDPGANTGETNVTLNANEGSMFAASVDLDNYGSRFTGEARLGATLNFNSPFGLGDQASVRLMKSNKDLAMLRGTYQIPVGSQGGRLGIAASRVVFEVCCQLGFNPTGASTMLSVFGSYPLERQRERSIFLTANFDNKQQVNQNNIAAAGQRELNVLTLGASIQSRDSLAGGGANFANFSLATGRLNIKDALGVTADAAGPKAEGGFSKLGYQLARTQRLTDLFSLYGGVIGQVASKNLDSAERFTLGGAQGVRGYPGGEASGDQGYIAQIELRADLSIDSSLQWQTFLFYDHGGIKVNRKPFGAGGLVPNNYELSSWGLGLNVAKTGAFQLRTMWAQKIGSNPGATAPNFVDADGKNDRGRLWFQAVTQF